jgi:rod shape-determining protein MreD
VREFARTTLIWVLVAFLGETVLAPMIDIRGIAPDFAVIALVILALAAGSMPATAAGFLIGLVQDLSNPTLLGLHALCKCGLGFGLGRLRGRLVYGMPVVESVVLVLAVLTHDLVFLLVQNGFGGQGSLGSFFLQSLPVAVYTGVVGLPVLRAAEFLGILQPEE